MNKKVTATLELNAKEGNVRAFSTVASRMDVLNRRAKEFNERQEAITRRQERANFVSRATVIATAAIGYAARDSLLDFAAVERQMTRIGNTADVSAQETAAAFAKVQDETRNLALPLQEGITALDTMVASGMSLKEALAFLPSVLEATQASGASAEDMANSALKSASALKIEAKQMQHAFDLMVASGKSGQFEANDMAAAIPKLASSFASLGYSGEEGLKQLLAILQTLRSHTATPGEAATQAQSLFTSMFSSDTIAKFKNFGIDLQKEMDAAAKSGEGAVEAFVRLSKQAVNGDLRKLPQLFTETEFQQAMTTLITSPDAMKKFIDVLNSAEVDGTVFRDTQKVLSDTQSSIQKVTDSWQTMKLSLGAAIAPVAVPLMDGASDKLDYTNAVTKGLQKHGYSWWQAQLWAGSQRDADKYALDGGSSDPDMRQRLWQGPVAPQGPRVPEFPGGDHKVDAYNLPETDVPIPRPRPARVTADELTKASEADASERNFRGAQDRFRQSQEGRRNADYLYSDSYGGMAVTDGFTSRISESMELGGTKAGTAAGTAIEQSGSTAADEMSRKIRDAGDSAAASMAGSILEAVNGAIQRVNAIGNKPTPRTLPQVNADLGRSMPPGSGFPGGDRR